MTKPHISLCMIVKNEEDWIERCLNSVKDMVDEMIIVDTGSTDKTLEICKSFKAQIEHFKWNGSFADARNYGIEKATGDWIIWLDADEELDEEDKLKLLSDGSHFHDYDVLSLHLINYLGDEMNKNNTANIAHLKLFRNNGIRFIHNMHECLNIDHIPKERIGHLDIKLHHYGYLNPVMEKKKKTSRNLEMLLQQLKKEEDIDWTLYHIGLEYYNRQQLHDALKYTNLSILAFLGNQSLPPAMVYNLKYSILIALERFDEAIQGIDKIIAIYPDYVSLFFYKGMILYHLKKYEASISCFNECLTLGENNPNYLIQRGMGSFQAWYCIGLCQQQLGNKHEALFSILNSLVLEPEFVDAIKTLAEISKNNSLLLQEFILQHYQIDTQETLKRIIQTLKLK